MLRRITAFVGLTVLLGTAFVSAQEKQTDDTIKVETKLVSVPTIVSDRDGRYIPNLTAADLTIFQDGEPQKIEFFAATEEPINIALLIDTSQSTRFVLGDIKDVEWWELRPHRFPLSGSRRRNACTAREFFPIGDKRAKNTGRANEQEGGPGWSVGDQPDNQEKGDRSPASSRREHQGSRGY